MDIVSKVSIYRNIKYRTSIYRIESFDTSKYQISNFDISYRKFRCIDIPVFDIPYGARFARYPPALKIYFYADVEGNVSHVGQTGQIDNDLDHLDPNHRYEII